MRRAHRILQIMKIRIIGIFILFFLLNIPPALAGDFFGLNFNLKNERDQKARKALEESAVWFITEGVAKYYQGIDVKRIEALTQKNGVHLSTSAIIGRDENLATIMMGYYWVRKWVSCFTRLQSDGKIYEYWVIETGSKRSDVKKEINFIITQANSIKHKREIIYRTDKFFSKFLLPNGEHIAFPVEDNYQLYRLSPWHYPDAYKGTELEDVEIIIQNHEYKRVQPR